MTLCSKPQPFLRYRVLKFLKKFYSLFHNSIVKHKSIVNKKNEEFDLTENAMVLR